MLANEEAGGTLSKALYPMSFLGCLPVWLSTLWKAGGSGPLPVEGGKEGMDITGGKMLYLCFN